jgi:hypothetical protein
VGHPAKPLGSGETAGSAVGWVARGRERARKHPGVLRALWVTGKGRHTSSRRCRPGLRGDDMVNLGDYDDHGRNPRISGYHVNKRTDGRQKEVDQQVYAVDHSHTAPPSEMGQAKKCCRAGRRRVILFAPTPHLPGCDPSRQTDGCNPWGPAVAPVPRSLGKVPIKRHLSS